MSRSRKKTVLVVEDDPKTADLIALYLTNDGFRAVKAHDGEAGLSLAERHDPALVILDLMLPKIDGWEVCRQLRNRSDVPVIMLTARGEEIDKVSGLTLGADDYVVKPFSPRELVARVRAVLRRTTKPPGRTPKRLIHGKIVLDLDRRRLVVADKTVALTRHEYVLLETLLSFPGKVFSRDELLDRLYPGKEAIVIERVVDVHIGKLRQKIENDSSAPRYILTVRGIGYRFADEEIDSNGALD
ncbi:MAG: response regulator transcription factor [Deltaproteobacteria bacterium]|jgi:DNA-binding response OmpR family regulator|nr:response regulator transcription factor [Deltaproteobacteria bacterium]